MTARFFFKRTLLLSLTILFPLLSGVDSWSEAEVPPNGIAREMAVDGVPTVSKKEFAYNPVGKRDPFQPQVEQAVKITAKERKEKGPLEKFELAQFRLSAILLLQGTPRAMVKAPDGKSYIVKPGDRIGTLDGEIVRIETKVIDPVTKITQSPDQVVVREIGFDPYSNKEVVEYRYIAM